MRSYLSKWILASNLMPVIVLFFGKIMNDLLVLIFWPGSIVLLSLGAEKKPLYTIVYTWIVAVGLNMILYMLVGVVVFFLNKASR